MVADSLDSAVDLINRNPMRNGVSPFTQSRAAARKFQSELDVGQVGINLPIPIPMPVPVFSFPGSRGSKLGDPGADGKQAIQDHTQTKIVMARWFDDAAVSEGVNTTIALK
ncbi:methylmalonate-semialdehyde dehydrogenase [Burkholderia lata]|nr:methylmalonate-semialdehyde dehydrogenase [Burkholderia lata]